MCPTALHLAQCLTKGKHIFFGSNGRGVFRDGAVVERGRCSYPSLASRRRSTQPAVLQPSVAHSRRSHGACYCHTPYHRVHRTQVLFLVLLVVCVLQCCVCFASCSLWVPLRMLVSLSLSLSLSLLSLTHSLALIHTHSLSHTFVLSVSPSLSLSISLSLSLSRSLSPAHAFSLFLSFFPLSLFLSLSFSLLLALSLTLAVIRAHARALSLSLARSPAFSCPLYAMHHHNVSLYTTHFIGATCKRCQTRANTPVP